MDPALIPAEVRAMIEESQRLASQLAEMNNRTAELRRLAAVDQSQLEKIFEKCSTSSTAKSEEECTICTSVVKHPIGCTRCNNLIGCLSCCKRWVKTANERGAKPSCPMCRHEWKCSEDVKEMVAEDKEK